MRYCNVDLQDWWTDLYVMVSRATRLSDLLLIRPPPVEFLLRGPPEGVKEQMIRFAETAEACRVDAARVTRELEMDIFL